MARFIQPLQDGDLCYISDDPDGTESTRMMSCCGWLALTRQTRPVLVRVLKQVCRMVSRNLGCRVTCPSFRLASTALRVEWCEAWARARCRREEVDLLLEDMRRVTQYHEWVAQEWDAGVHELSGSRGMFRRCGRIYHSAGHHPAQGDGVSPARLETRWF